MYRVVGFLLIWFFFLISSPPSPTSQDVQEYYKSIADSPTNVTFPQSIVSHV